MGVFAYQAERSAHSFPTMRKPTYIAQIFSPMNSDHRSA